MDMGPWQVTLRAEPLLFLYALILITRKKILHKSALFFEVDSSKTLEVALLRAEPFLGTKHMYCNPTIPQPQPFEIILSMMSAINYSFSKLQIPVLQIHVSDISLLQKPHYTNPVHCYSVGIPNKPSSQSHSLYPHSPPDSSCFRFQLGD